MRNLFPGSYRPSDADFAKMWAEGTFVFDTNMLLNFHRYAERARQEFLGILSAPDVSPRIWIPYQVALEYHRNLDNVRYEQVAACLKMRKSLAEWATSLRADDHKTRAAQLQELADKFVADAEEHYKHPDRRALIEQIADLFEGKVGTEWEPERLKKAYKEGEERYAKKIPPGFGDLSEKKGDDRYGDLVVWLQVIEEAEKRRTPIIFVTDDTTKDDWWLRIGGKTIGPLPALTNEIHRGAGVLFYMYSGDRFLEQARTSLKRTVRDETVAEVKQVRVEQQKRHGEQQKRHEEPQEKLWALLDERALVERRLEDGKMLFDELNLLLSRSQNEKETAKFVSRIYEVGAQAAELTKRRDILEVSIEHLKQQAALAKRDANDNSERSATASEKPGSS